MGEKVNNESSRSISVSGLAACFADEKRRKIVSALFGLLFSALVLLLICLSFAWFAQNNVTIAKGMSVQMAVPPELIISDDEQLLRVGNIFSLNGGNPYAVTQDSAVTKFYPATHDGDYEAYENGLKTTSEEDTFVIDRYTGVGEGLEYSSALNPSDESERHYYVDYTVYIAASSAPMDNASLKLTITSEADSDSHRAASVDVYKDSASEENFIGTLNMAGIDGSANKFPLSDGYPGTALTELYVLGSDGVGYPIPFREDGCLCYVLRFYFDGALLKSAEQTFVRSAELDISELQISLSFIAEELA